MPAANRIQSTADALTGSPAPTARDRRTSSSRSDDQLCNPQPSACTVPVAHQAEQMTGEAVHDGGATQAALPGNGSSASAQEAVPSSSGSEGIRDLLGNAQAGAEAAAAITQPIAAVDPIPSTESSKAWSRPATDSLHGQGIDAPNVAQGLNQKGGMRNANSTQLLSPSRPSGDTLVKHAKAGPESVQEWDEYTAAMGTVSPLRPGDALEGPAKEALEGLRGHHDYPVATQTISPMRPGNALEGPAREALEGLKRQKEGRQRAAAELWKQMQDLSLQTNAMLHGAMHPSPPRPKASPPISPPSAPDESPKLSATTISDTIRPESSHRHRSPDEEQVWTAATKQGQGEARNGFRKLDSWAGKPVRTPAKDHIPSGPEAEGLQSSAQANAPGNGSKPTAGPPVGGQPMPWPLPVVSQPAMGDTEAEPDGSVVDGSQAEVLMEEPAMLDQKCIAESLGERRGSGDAARGMSLGPRGKENAARLGNSRPALRAATATVKPSARYVPRIYWPAWWMRQAEHGPGYIGCGHQII